MAAGQAVWTIATSAGIAELIQASEPAFLALKVAGAAAYLVALGFQSLWTAVRPSFASLWTPQRTPMAGRLRSPTGGPDSHGSRWCAPWRGRPARGGTGHSAAGPGAGGRTGLRPGRAFRQGVVSNLANPKMAAFFLSLLPQFAAPGHGGGGILGLGLVFCLLTFGWLGLYSAAVDRARVVLGRSRARRGLEGVSGVVLLGFGARLVLQQR